MSLLNQALLQEGKPRKGEIQHNAETVELAVAWVKGIVSAAQINSVMGFSRSAPVYSFVASAIRWGFMHNELDVHLVAKEEQ